MSKIKWLLGVSLVLPAVFLVGCGSESESGPRPETVTAQSQPSEHAAGEALYVKNCKVCHAQGLNGAPIVGNKKMWGPRAEQGSAVLVGHAVNGFGLMPAKGGKTDLTEEQITAVVEYMLSKLE